MEALTGTLKEDIWGRVISSTAYRSMERSDLF